MNLFQAIRDNDLGALRRVLQDSPDLEQQEPGGAETPLTLAVSRQRVDALKLLLEAGANPSYVLPDLEMKLTILQAAASKPDPGLMRALIDAGADLNATNIMGSTALNEALDKGHLEAVDALLNAGADVNTGTKGFQKSSALIQAVGHGYFDLIPRLLKLGANINQANSEGATPLMFALVADAEWRNTRPTDDSDRLQREMIEQLLLAGADPNAALTQEVYMLNDGSSLSEGMTPLMVAARKGDRTLVQRLLDAGAERSLRDENNQTALDWAVKAGHPDVVTLLQATGDSTSIDLEKLKVTSLMTAAREGNVGQLQKLIDQGVELNVVDPDRSRWGRTALIHAITNEHLPAVGLLLKSGANPNQQEKQGRQTDESPLHHAAALKDSRFAKVLLEAGADPNVVNAAENTPLVDAARQGCLETVELLLNAGALPVLPEREKGNQPLLAALESGHADVAHRLLDAGHPLDGNVLVAAAFYGQPSVVRRVLEAGVSAESRAPFGASDVQCGNGSSWNHADYEPDRELDEAENRRTPLVAVAEIHAAITGFSPHDEEEDEDDSEEDEFDEEFDEDDDDEPDDDDFDDEFDDDDDDEFDDFDEQKSSGPLLERAEQIQAEIIQLLLEAGADPNGRDDCGRTPLIALAARNNMVTVNIKSNLDPDDDSDETLIGKLDPVPAMKLLLESGADLNAADHRGRTVLHELTNPTLSSYPDPVAIANFLLQAGAEVDARDHEGQTPLMLAMDTRNPDLTRLLMEFGANVNAVDQDDKTVLMYAVEDSWEPETLTDLLKRGADVNARSRAGETALSIACWYENKANFAELLKQAGAENPWEKEIELKQAAKAGDRSRVRELLEQGADVNHVHRGTTALQTALYEFALAKGDSNEELVKDLLNAGADVALGSDSDYMYPPLLQAISARKPDLVRLILEHGADPNAKHLRNRTPALHAAQCGELEIVDMLLKAGAEEDPLTKIFLAAYRWEAPARSVEFQQCLADLEEFTGLKARPLERDKGRGVVTVVVNAEHEARALRDADPDLSEHTAEWIAYGNKVNEIFAALQGQFLERGCYMCQVGSYAVVDRGRVLGLFPTVNPFEIMAFVNVRGNEVELSTDQIISWFQRLYQDHPFRLTACLGDTVDITLLNPVSDPMKLARVLERFCPDMVSQGTETLGALAEQLRTSRHVHFWWD